MVHYKNMNNLAFMAFCLFMLVVSFGSETVSSSVQEEKGDANPQRTRVEVSSKRDLLVDHLPRQIEALKTIEGTFQATMNSQRESNPLAAFKAACSLSNLQSLRSSIQDVLSCLQKEDDPNTVSIGIGSAPGIKQEIDRLIGYLDEARVTCDSLKALAIDFQKITADIPNPDFSANSTL